MNFILSLIFPILFTGIVTFFIGRTILFLTGNKFYFEQESFGKLSLSIFTGFISISSVTGLISTNGKSLSWLVFIPLVIFLIAFSGKRSNEDQFKLGKALIALPIIFILSLVTLWISSGIPFNPLDINIDCDFYYYGKTISSLMSSGIESSMAIYQDTVAIETNSIYHYGNMWYSGFFLSILNCSEVEFLLFVAYPLHITTGILGCVSFFKPKNINQAILISLFVILLIFGANIILPSDAYLVKPANIWFGDVFCANVKVIKITPIFAGAPILFYFIKKENLLALAIWVLILAGIYITIIPGILGLFTGVFIFRYLFDKKEKSEIFNRQLFQAVGLLTIGILFLFIFKEFATNSKKTIPWFEVTKLEALKTALEYYSFPYIVFLGLSIGLIWASIKRSMIVLKVLFAISFGIFSSVVFVMLNIFQPDINQVIFNYINPFGFVLPSFTISQLWNKKSNQIIPIVVLFLINTIHNISELKLEGRQNHYDTARNFKQEVISTLRKGENWALLKNKTPWTWYFHFFNPAQFALNYKETTYPIDITTSFSNSPLKKVNTPFEGSEFNLIQFLKENKIQYIFIEGQATVPEILNIELITKDVISGHKFYRIIY